MDIPPEIVSLAAVATAAAPLLVTALSKGISTISAALATRTTAKANAEVKIAEAKKIDADAKKVEADAKKSEADTELTRAATDKVQAESAAQMLLGLQRRLEATEEKNIECEKRNDERDATIEKMRRQMEADGELIAKFSERAINDEKRMKKMNEDILELRRVIRLGGINA